MWSSETLRALSAFIGAAVATISLYAAMTGAVGAADPPDAAALVSALLEADD
ncbi:MAG: hypothetical protein WD969_09710 [Paracoccaceae bacterium]